MRIPPHSGTSLGLGLALAVAAGAGCMGRIGDDAAPPAEPGLGTQCAGAEPEATVMRMLNRREYGNTVRDLLGVSSDIVATFPADPIVGFDNHADSLVASSLLVEKHFDAAETIASTADVASLVPCAAPDQCIDELIATFGKRAYRRPLEADESAALRGIYDRARAAGRDEDTAVRLVIQGALMAPQFLYRAETSISQSGGLVPVDGYELAARLSYFLWASMPDDALLDAAETGALDTPEQVAEQARRMLSDPKAREVTQIFHQLWLELYKLESTTKNDTAFDALKSSFAQETTDFTEHVFWSGTARDYLLSATPFIDDALQAHYGTSERLGLLTQGSLLSMYSNPDRTSPTKRGKFVRTQLLCQPPPPPPADVPPLETTTVTEGTLRERLAAHVENPACSGCHRLIDPIGFGLEHYDTVGRHRTEDAGLPVDASGELVDVDPGAGSFVGARELAERLAQTDEFHSCVVTQWFRFAAGRHEGKADSCAIDGLVVELREAGEHLPELLVAIARSDALRFKNTEKSP